MSSSAQPDLAPILTVSLLEEADIVTARQRARQLSAALGFSGQEQVRIATAVSEIARNAHQYAGGGRVDFALDLHSRPQLLAICVSDKGPGIPDVPAALASQNHSGSGLGLGLAGTRRLMDVFEVDSSPAGTTVRFGKHLAPSPKTLTLQDLRQLGSRLSAERPADAPREVQRQNRELLEALETLRAREIELDRRQSELERLNAELDETNRGVVALYAELDEKARELRNANELKTRFLWHVSHEFRTPLNSILGLGQLLLRRIDGDLTEEQERQVQYIRKAAEGLIEMVNDLLDLAKVESGKTEVARSRIPVAPLLGALRGMLRPLVSESVALIFEDVPEGLEITSDESKLTQILRNLISNALKFTEQGSVRVSCRVHPGSQVMFAVADTGIGIAPGDQEAIFQEFAQVANPLQRKVKGTGLGLPLSRRLATLLGGTLEVSSMPGQGSTFTLTLPVGSAGEAGPDSLPPQRETSDAVLIIDDEEMARYLARQLFRGSPRRILEAASGAVGAELARFEKPALILLDLMMPGGSGFDVLDELKADPATAEIPVVIHTSKTLHKSDQDRLAGRYAAVLPKDPDRQAETLDYIRRLLGEESLFVAELHESTPRG
jgi:signal transduction histidine kinase/CheY-like chemotaxis protein